MNRPQRMWINQPSIYQALHHLHGVNVLAVQEYAGVYSVYFLEGPTESQQVFSSALSPGWATPRQIIEDRATPAEIKDAKETCGSDNIAIDGDAKVSRADDGVWVEAWVWLDRKN